jgi:hypothetical protein
MKKRGRPRMPEEQRQEALERRREYWRKWKQRKRLEQRKTPEEKTLDAMKKLFPWM